VIADDCHKNVFTIEIHLGKWLLLILNKLFAIATSNIFIDDHKDLLVISIHFKSFMIDKLGSIAF